ncbi:ISAon1 family transposase N-terminal region protein [Winogradskyella psychrotolerans]|uniref:ISAon1 family transposase N-terminal region protein n=1 Tax=Winogradskyella psychrotolerans TaxID=1344585 RepID=UPI0020902853|nr:transposase [Winogradskyella psychrotolerans]
MDNYLELLKLILPEFLIDHFDLIRHTKNGEVMHLYFEERNITPKEETARELIAHGFHKQATIQDLPLRGNTVYLHVKRRTWLDKTT